MKWAKVEADSANTKWLSTRIGIHATTPLDDFLHQFFLSIFNHVIIIMTKSFRNVSLFYGIH